MFWILIILLIYIVAVIFFFIKIRESRLKVDQAQQENIRVAKEEHANKKNKLTEFASLALGYVKTEEITDANNLIQSIEMQLNSEKGKQAIAEAEVEALDLRLRELEELKRELEVSNLDAIKEVEMLKAQQRDMANQNEGIKSQIKYSLDQIDLLIGMLENNEAAQAELSKSREHLIEAEKKILFYEIEITKINKQYIGLKKAYDALDIEYAQLYEKRQQQMDNNKDN